MAVNFATPIAHQTHSNYSAFNSTLAEGRSFRQPLQTAPNPRDFSPGLELFLSSVGDVAAIFSWFDGILRWQEFTAAGTISVANGSPTVTGAGTNWGTDLEGRTLQVVGETDWYLILRVDSATQLTLDQNYSGATGAGKSYTVEPRHRLILNTEPTVLGRGSLAKLKMVEGKPVRVLYENVDKNAVQTALETLLNDAYTSATGSVKSWHPSMRMRIQKGKKKIHLKRLLDQESDPAAKVQNLAADFLAGTPAPDLKEIRVLAGETIGRAAPYLVTDPVPSSPPFDLGAPTAPDRARRLTFRTEDNCGQAINPLHYLHIFMQQMLLPSATRVVNSLTDIVSSGTLAHPLVTLFPALSGSTIPPAREQLNGQSRIPLGPLANFHGHPPNKPRSKLEWHYTDQGVFEAQGRVAGAAPPRLTPNATETGNVQALWTAHGAGIANICEALQIPCELIFLLVGAESASDPLRVRLEPHRSQERQKMNRAGISRAEQIKYDHATGVHGTLNSVAHNSNGTSRLDITLDAPRKWRSNILKSVSASVLVDDVDHLAVTNHSPTGVQTTNYQITVNDRKFEGGFAKGGTQNAMTELYYSPSQRAAGNASEAPVRQTLERAGKIRILKVNATDNTVNGDTIITVFHEGTATSLTVTLPAGAKSGSDTTHTFTTAATDKISVQVKTEGTTGTIKNLKWSLLHAPVDTNDPWVLSGFSTSVPNPWNGPANVRAGRTLTWDQLEDIVDATGGRRISPGLVQTLISTAKGRASVLSATLPNIFATLGILTPPSTAGGFLHDPRDPNELGWLLHAVHSILLGAAVVRKGYNANNTCFDLPLVANAYNSGRVKPRSGKLWGTSLRDTYIAHGGPWFNAAADLFNTPGLIPAPTVRFMR